MKFNLRMILVMSSFAITCFVFAILFFIYGDGEVLAYFCGIEFALLSATCLFAIFKLSTEET